MATTNHLARIRAPIERQHTSGGSTQLLAEKVKNTIIYLVKTVKH
jgi:hypothetical protein